MISIGSIEIRVIYNDMLICYLSHNIISNIKLKFSKIYFFNNLIRY